MITPDYCATMARYNRWQNAHLIAAADTLAPEALTQDRGAFFGSILGTFSHVLWGDLIWLSRLTGSPAPRMPIGGSDRMHEAWEPFCAERRATDAAIIDKAAALTETDLAGDLAWHSALAGRDFVQPRALLWTHLFNHQTHHRGQIHAMLTAAGATTGSTDLPFMPETEDQ